jgi:peptidoglycan-associated lipoprotein
MDKRNFNSLILLSIITAAMVVVMAGTAQGQYVIKRADSKAELYNYAQAISLYEKA